MSVRSIRSGAGVISSGPARPTRSCPRASGVLRGSLNVASTHARRRDETLHVGQLLSVLPDEGGKPSGQDDPQGDHEDRPQATAGVCLRQAEACIGPMFLEHLFGDELGR